LPITAQATNTLAVKDSLSRQSEGSTVKESEDRDYGYRSELRRSPTM